jgi:hypothetical protein
VIDVYLSKEQIFQGKKRQKKSKLENERSDSGSLQQVRRFNDASQSMQELWHIQQA